MFIMTRVSYNNAKKDVNAEGSIDRLFKAKNTRELISTQINLP